MKGSRAVIMLLLSLVAGLSAVVLAARWLTDRAAATTQQVVVASRDVDIGQPINATMVEVVPWPAGALPKGAFSDPKALDGRVLVANLLKGEAILEARLAPVGTKGGLSAVIPGGKRAITVRVNEVVGVAGFALPGNYVDVMVSTLDDDQKQVSKIVLERILVLAVAQEAGRDETRPRLVNAVTLEVSPEHAEKLDLARSVGTLSLVLRNQIDANPTATGGARKADLLSDSAATREAKAAAAPPPPPRPARPVTVVSKPPPEPVKVEAPPAPEPKPTVEVIRGTQRVSAQVE